MWWNIGKIYCGNGCRWACALVKPIGLLRSPVSHSCHTTWCIEWFKRKPYWTYTYGLWFLSTVPVTHLVCVTMTLWCLVQYTTLTLPWWLIAQTLCPIREWQSCDCVHRFWSLLQWHNFSYRHGLTSPTFTVGLGFDPWELPIFWKKKKIFHVKW